MKLTTPIASVPTSALTPIRSARFHDQTGFVEAGGCIW